MFYFLCAAYYILKCHFSYLSVCWACYSFDWVHLTCHFCSTMIIVTCDLLTSNTVSQWPPTMRTFPPTLGFLRFLFLRLKHIGTGQIDRQTPQPIHSGSSYTDANRNGHINILNSWFWPLHLYTAFVIRRSSVLQPHIIQVCLLKPVRSVDLFIDFSLIHDSVFRHF